MIGSVMDCKVTYFFTNAKILIVKILRIISLEPPAQGAGGYGQVAGEVVLITELEEQKIVVIRCWFVAVQSDESFLDFYIELKII